MKRLTKSDGKRLAESCCCNSLCEYMRTIVNKLAEYEDLEAQERLLRLPCELGDSVFVIIPRRDGGYHIFEMTVCDMEPFGGIHNGKVWNMRLEDGSRKVYRSFYDFGNTVFLKREDADDAVRLRRDWEQHFRARFGKVL